MSQATDIQNRMLEGLNFRLQIEIPMRSGKAHEVTKVFKSVAIVEHGWMKIYQSYACTEGDPDDDLAPTKDYYRDICMFMELRSINTLKCSFVQDWDVWQIIIANPTDSFIQIFTDEEEARHIFDLVFNAIRQGIVNS